MIINSEAELSALRRVGRIVALARDTAVGLVQPGITTAAIDAAIDSVLAQHGARSAPRTVYAFPGCACISLNDVAAHGIPGPRVVRVGDLVNIDVSAELDGFFADTGISVATTGTTPRGQQLCRCAESAFWLGIAAARPGSLVSAIGRAIEGEARARGFRVIRNLTGHGIGRQLHEAPRCIFNYEEPRSREQLRAGMVLAVETFISTGAELVSTDPDGWSLRTPDGSLVAQYEHTIVVDRSGPMVLTAL